MGNALIETTFNFPKIYLVFKDENTFFTFSAIYLQIKAKMYKTIQPKQKLAMLILFF